MMSTGHLCAESPAESFHLAILEWKGDCTKCNWAPHFQRLCKRDCPRLNEQLSSVCKCLLGIPRPFSKYMNDMAVWALASVSCDRLK
jgi:hypothetical protein